MAENSGVLIICEINDGILSSLSTELLGCGKKLADASGQELAAVLIGSGIPLFGPGDKDIGLEHIETRSYANGFVQSRYEVCVNAP